ncbi:hypothetical protein ACFS7Z_26270 [Pontibacter toksunensis]|uniref:Uncharacterized protein n=2 Tax=Pontibacter toksunensis TaxID=1332631 RepID=A0ABW6C6P2_9BACT
MGAGGVIFSPLREQDAQDSEKDFHQLRHVSVSAGRMAELVERIVSGNWRNKKSTASV